MTCNPMKIAGVVSTLAASMLFSTANATPTVNGNVISWTEEGWHQVQLQSTYESVCNGGRQCTVPAGVYTVINHGTGERFPNIAVPNNTSNDSSNIPAPVGSSGQKTSQAFGDDGDFQSGVVVPGSRFQDNEDGTFTDALTGITWLGVRDCIVRRNWAGSLEYANNLSSASGGCPGLSDGSMVGDWRLPNIKEIYSLIDISDHSPALAEGMPFSGEWENYPWDRYWSSSSFEPVPDNTAFAMDVGFGLIYPILKEVEYYVWPIRIN